MPEISYREAVSSALREALNADLRVFLVGEDIGPYGGAYAVTKGFTEEFGPDRIKDSPLSESAFVGASVGAAMGGLRPIVELMTINFSMLAMDQIINHAAKVRYMSGGQLSAPLIIRTVTGGGAQVAATHSQNFEGWFATVPGMKVVVPSTPYDVVGLFRSCREETDPVMFVEHILLYSSRGEVPEGVYKVPLGASDVKRKAATLPSSHIRVCSAGPGRCPQAFSGGHRGRGDRLAMSEAPGHGACTGVRAQDTPCPGCGGSLEDGGLRSGGRCPDTGTRIRLPRWPGCQGWRVRKYPCPTLDRWNKQPYRTVT